MENHATARIRALNDDLRAHGRGGLTLVTRGVFDHGLPFAARVRAAIARDALFTLDTDSYEEHDFGSVEIEGSRIFWKIDYYDLTRTAGSPNPADPSVTSRVMTIMMADEY